MDVQKRNFIIIWFANFLVAGTMTMIMPFLSLYIETFGDHSDAYVQKWSGLIFGAVIHHGIYHVTDLGTNRR